MALDYGTANGISVKMGGPYASGGGFSVKMSSVTLYADAWKNSESPYFQNVVIEGISASSMVNIQADRDQIARLGTNGTAVHIDNDGGMATAYAVGVKPAEDMILQVSLTEVTGL